MGIYISNSNKGKEVMNLRSKLERDVGVVRRRKGKRGNVITF